MKDANAYQLHWIDTTSSDGPFDRSKVRRQTMQKVALRRKNQPKKPHPNSRQVPIFIHVDQDNESQEHHKDEQTHPELEIIDADGYLQSDDTIIAGLTDLHCLSRITYLPVDITYPSMPRRCKVDISDLSLLASIDVGRYTGEKLLRNPQNLVFFLGGKNWSFCRFIPFFYSRSTLVQHATDCVLARVRSFLSPGEEWESLAISSYSKALCILQEAINSASQPPSADVLCATQILGLYELLNPIRKGAWSKHAAGAASIIRLRGPDSYGSEFEKSLLMSHVGPMITEAILNNEKLFLDDPIWRTVLLSVVTDNPLEPERSTMVNAIVSILIAVPGLFKDITHAICNDDQQPLTTTLELVSRARKSKAALRQWYRTYFGLYVHPTNVHSVNDNTFKLMVLYYICTIYVNRLSTCIFWTDEADIEELEEETQRCAKFIVTISKEEAYQKLPSSLLLAQKVPIAEAAVRSADEWRGDWSFEEGSSRLFKVSRKTFSHWCELFGRRTV
ncbi:hypothetical protein BT63DRAFT_430066 [Microthyrium microscopicum]|uniref:Uncharacterized protein n=1 Tax=Microthyrium microscopicum TaxID=703497 RepID=A0A6A6TWU1_9PEZI|nr:hypothetical protein BT63DRAFT_430066 [Microthyrium microscopicum]